MRGWLARRLPSRAFAGEWLPLMVAATVVAATTTTCSSAGHFKRATNSNRGAFGTCLGSPTGGSLAVVNAEPKTADGMPMLGETTHQRVSALLASSHTDLLARCPGALDVTVEPGPGKAWQ